MRRDDDPEGGDDDRTAGSLHLDRDGVLESFPLPGGWRRFVAWAPSGSTSDAADRLRDANVVDGVRR